ncbi:glycylpeptide N-tetradecanoyltransferase-like isoform X2 [Dysidea avara]
MLELWLHKQPKATWNQLIEALKAPGIELDDVASEIEGIFESSTKESSCTKHLEPVLSPSSSQVALTFSPDQDIDYAFTKLSAAIKMMIQHSQFGILQDACIETATSPKSFISSGVVSKIEEANTFKALCTTLTKSHYWNFLDTRMMEAMVTASMVPAAQQSLENYKKTFFGKELSEVVPHYVPVIPLKSGHTIMMEVLDKDLRKLTINELHKHRFYLETELLETGTDTLAYYKITVGSVIIMWQVHVDHVYQAYTSLNKKQCQLSLQAITHLSIPEAVMWEKIPVLWRGQQMGQIGPIETVDHVRQEPYPLPEGLKWSAINFNSIDEVAKLYGRGNIGDYEHQIQWSISHPCFKDMFFVGIRLASSNELTWAAYCFQSNIRFGEVLLHVVTLEFAGQSFLGQQGDLYGAALMEIIRRANLSGIPQAMLGNASPLVIRPVVVLTQWGYYFSDPSYPPLPYNSPRTHGLRKMTLGDVSKALTLTNQYASQFEIGQVFQSEKEFLHYVICPSLPGRVITYVVEDPITASITDLFTFKLENFTETQAKAAAVIALVCTSIPARQLITDLLLCAKQEQALVLLTFQFGLGKENFKYLLKQINRLYYIHICNYKYPEVDEENFCVFTVI